METKQEFWVTETTKEVIIETITEHLIDQLCDFTRTELMILYSLIQTTEVDQDIPRINHFYTWDDIANDVKTVFKNSSLSSDEIIETCLAMFKKHEVFISVVWGIAVPGSKDGDVAIEIHPLAVPMIGRVFEGVLN